MIYTLISFAYVGLLVLFGLAALVDAVLEVTRGR